ncbi:catechol 2,3-dioxygenase-like lactoylglutathione lyase family enzyme [Aquimarina sp. EL_43]|uniref:VOC family protein n=1 Tax=unclassified Aquimarina TaxID=2627091 RepID=UPI0018C90CA0|nr:MULTISPECIES: VOC family protein [unclassified Aquimarina]MBG6129003.1 catechol 2,3-dioxygenase-like lactoylglutathione lyase family enzyme [Aquimarina sp. EL_35]MBG6150067.1 catechol 2,3-dioxygenase-like lactoylglutathione lyase family enzyme [Aquimarina sp. EL_32]MBG6167247.1 catechol 2,3-dioxygenase-like lactoylglutathione lyase family enzyme [Aquimarina sp. EL_43]
MKIDRIDYIVLTVKDIEKTIQFYTTLGMEAKVFDKNRSTLTFGNQKINLHQKGKEFEPKAKNPTYGSGDLCFIVSTEIESVKIELENKGIDIVTGIVHRTGAMGEIRSIYIRDPDQNLIELSNYE